MRTDPVHHHDNRASTSSSSSTVCAGLTAHLACPEIAGPPRLPFESARQNTRCPPTVTRLLNQQANRNKDLTVSNQSLTSNHDPITCSASNYSLKSSASQSTIKSFASSNQGTLKASSSYQSTTLSSSSSSSSYENNTIKPSSFSSSSNPVGSRADQPPPPLAAVGCNTIAGTKDSAAPCSTRPQQPTNTQQRVVYASSPNLRFTPSHPLRLALHQGAAISNGPPCHTQHHRAHPPFLAQTLQQQQQLLQQHYPQHYPQPARSPTGTGSLLNIPFPIKTPTHGHQHYVPGAGPCSPPIYQHQKSLQQTPPPQQQQQQQLDRQFQTPPNSDLPRAYGTVPAKPASSASGDEAPKSKKKFLKLTPFRTSAKKSKKSKKCDGGEGGAGENDGSLGKSTTSLNTITPSTTPGGGGDDRSMMTTSTISTSDYQDLDAYSTTSSNAGDPRTREEDNVVVAARERSASSRSGAGGFKSGNGGSQRSTAPLLCASSNVDLAAANSGGGAVPADRDTPTHHGSLHNFLFSQRGGPLAFFNPFSASTNLDSPDTSLHDTSVDSQVTGRGRRGAQVPSVVFSVCTVLISYFFCPLLRPRSHPGFRPGFHREFTHDADERSERMRYVHQRRTSVGRRRVAALLAGRRPYDAAFQTRRLLRPDEAQPQEPIEANQVDDAPLPRPEEGPRRRRRRPRRKRRRWCQRFVRMPRAIRTTQDV